MKTPEDVLIDALKNSDGLQSLDQVEHMPEASIVDCFRPELLNKAYWCYSAVQSLNGISPMNRENFVSSYKLSWAEFFLSAANAASITDFSLLPVNELPSIIFTCHFPLYPTLFGLDEDKERIAALVKRKAPWMPTSNSLLIDDMAILTKLYEKINDGKSVIAMLDFAYSTTRNSIVPFLGIPSQTPIGLIELSLRLKCKIGVILPRDNCGRLELIVIDDSFTKNTDNLAFEINSLLSNWIMSNPTKWLLWPNLNHRWIGEL